jgi:hypothetical protein
MSLNPSPLTKPSSDMISKALVSDELLSHLVLSYEDWCTVSISPFCPLLLQYPLSPTFSLQVLMYIIAFAHLTPSRSRLPGFSPPELTCGTLVTLHKNALAMSLVNVGHIL